MMIKTLKVMFAKAGIAKTTGKQVYSPRLSLPGAWLEVIGVTREHPYVQIKLEPGKIIITSAK